jgi:hypothetical protein
MASFIQLQSFSPSALAPPPHEARARADTTATEKNTFFMVSWFDLSYMD